MVQFPASITITQDVLIPSMDVVRGPVPVPAPASGGSSFGIIAGNWYGLGAGQVVGAVGPDAGYIDYAPLILSDVAHSYAAIGVSVNTAPSVSTTIRLGIFSDLNGEPGPLLWDAGDVALTATGTNAIPLTGAPAFQGKVWGAIGFPSAVNGLQLLGYSEYGSTALAPYLGTVSPLSTSDNLVGYIGGSYSYGPLPANAVNLSQRTGSSISALALQA